MKNTQKKAPALRFKDDGGKDYPNWQKKNLGDVGEIIGGGTPDTKQKSFWNGDVIWFTPTEIKSKYSGDSINKISNEGLAKSSAKLLPVGTVLFTSRATIGEVSVATLECTTNQGFQSFVVDVSSFSNEYIYYWIIKNKKQFLLRANGSTFLEIGKNEIKKIPFSTPHIEEQQKIAAFLSTVDTRIEQLNRKKSLLAQYKKGMMQKLFSREIRFKDGEGKDYPDWEEKKLDDVVKIHRGSGLSKSAIHLSGRIPCILYGELFTKYTETINQIYSFTNDKAKVVGKYGDILMPAF